MDKKKFVKNSSSDDLKGFEEFIEGDSSDASFLPKPSGNAAKKEVSFEHFTFLSNDAERMTRTKNLLTHKIPFAAKFEQGQKLLEDQMAEIKVLKTKLFGISDKDGSPYRRSLIDIFDSFFAPPKETPSSEQSSGE